MNEAFYGYMILFIGILCWVWLLSYDQIRTLKRYINNLILKLKNQYVNLLINK